MQMVLMDNLGAFAMLCYHCTVYMIQIFRDQAVLQCTSSWAFESLSVGTHVLCFLHAPGQGQCQVAQLQVFHAPPPLSKEGIRHM